MTDRISIRGLLNQAEAFYAEGKLLHASQIYHRILSTDPSVQVAWLRLSHIQGELKQFDAADRTLQKALEQFKDSREMHFYHGLLELRRGHYARALLYFRRLLPAERRLPKIFRSHLHFNIGVANWHLQKIRLAESHLRKADQIDPEFFSAGELLGELLIRRNESEEEIRVLRRVTSGYPFKWQACYWLGVALMRRGAWDEALKELTKAVEQNPNEPSGWLKSGEALMELGRIPEAEQQLRRAMELSPHWSEAIASYGTLLLKINEPGQAEEYFERALELDPANERARQAKLRIVGHESPR